MWKKTCDGVGHNATCLSSVKPEEGGLEFDLICDVCFCVLVFHGSQVVCNKVRRVDQPPQEMPRAEDAQLTWSKFD